MSQPQRLIKLPLLGAILLGLLAMLFFAGKKRPGKSDPATSAGTHTVGNPGAALKYWTEEKMRKARPAPMPQTDDLKPGKEPPQRS